MFPRLSARLDRQFAAGAPGLYQQILDTRWNRPLISLMVDSTPVRATRSRRPRCWGSTANTLRKKIRELDIKVVRGVKSG